MATSRSEFRSSLFRALESWSIFLRLCFSHVWDSVHAFVRGDAKSVLSVVFGRWRGSPPREAVMAEIIDIINATEDKDLIEGLGILMQEACMNPAILARLKRIALCADRIDKLDSGKSLYALRAEREFIELMAGMSPCHITCEPDDLLKHVRAELPLCDDIATTYRLLLAMRELEYAALERISRDKKISVEEKKHLREQILVADAIAYASWAESQCVFERLVPRGSGGRRCLVWSVN